MQNLKNYINIQNKKKIEFFSTPFDEESFYFLESLGVRLFKIASFDVTNLKLIDIISNSKKTIILSTGMSTLKEVEQAFNIFKNKKSKLILLHCVSSYPISEDEANLLVIKKLKEKFNCLVGYSDHTNDIKTSLYSACMGAQVIEKHFMIDKRMNCVDKSVSITEKQLNKLNLELDNLDKILGSGKKTITNAEKKNIIFKRKIKI